MKILLQNLCGMAKAVHEDEFIAVNVFIRKQETSKLNHLSPHIKKLEEQIKSRRRNA